MVMLLVAMFFDGSEFYEQSSYRTIQDKRLLNVKALALVISEQKLFFIFLFSLIWKMATPLGVKLFERSELFEELLVTPVY